jgi:transcriptional regulator with XRE-family HTH domain
MFDVRILFSCFFEKQHQSQDFINCKEWEVVGEAIREARRARGWTQNDLADFMGWSRVKVQRLEAGDSKSIPTEQIPRLARLLNLNFQKMDSSTAKEGETNVECK